MDELPEPPSFAELVAVPPEWRTLPSDTELWRIYFRGSDHPTAWNSFRHYGPVRTARFDHHLPPPSVQARGILYAAIHYPICVAEVFQDQRTVYLIAQQPWLVSVKLAASVKLLDLTGLWPTRLGCGQTISSGNRSRAQQWARSIYDAYPEAQGLWYRSSMYGGEPAIALFERAVGCLPTTPTFHHALNDPALAPTITDVAGDLGYFLVD